MTVHARPPPRDYRPYDRRSLTYSSTFPDPWKAGAIRTIEWLTGKVTILRLIRAFEKRGAPQGQAIWKAVLDTMGIRLTTPRAHLERIPPRGPLVVVANHPHGLVDGLVLAEMIGRIRTDYKVLTRSLLTAIDEVAASYLIPVPFPHEADAQRKMMEMRATAMDELRAGGVVALFPSGVVAASETLMGPAIEAEWNVFTAKMIRRSGARVVPVYFPGSNSRLYQIANRISPTLRQGLLLHEIVHSCNRPQGPIIGHPIDADEIAGRAGDPRAFMAWLRDRTLALRHGAPEDPGST